MNKYEKEISTLLTNLLRQSKDDLLDIRDKIQTAILYHNSASINELLNDCLDTGISICDLIETYFNRKKMAVKQDIEIRNAELKQAHMRNITEI